MGRGPSPVWKGCASIDVGLPLGGWPTGEDVPSREEPQGWYSQGKAATRDRNVLLLAHPRVPSTQCQSPLPVQPRRTISHMEGSPLQSLPSEREATPTLPGLSPCQARQQGQAPPQRVNASWLDPQHRASQTWPSGLPRASHSGSLDSPCSVGSTQIPEV